MDVELWCGARPRYRLSIRFRIHEMDVEDSGVVPMTADPPTLSIQFKPRMDVEDSGVVPYDSRPPIFSSIHNHEMDVENSGVVLTTSVHRLIHTV
ncbi:hypothetical protein AVEN_231223-1 [Araneus ventricosus]|uniref:Uncharacterized protein n=1 Tax=Araneus ventricosus TaxID=182803 RepID=A0A4Y2TCL4_ARAVE|nr:hypothetical protein AVEN_231223-1 [Araneus ventricosus]